ncbi:3-isopropylmalate dehydratase small subunit [Microvirga arabica]|uniref:3-isopropylmalate dehydratase small subunit n=1 Tax=Microvirga arabica TaxID=1128671 RepID=A0ABV6YBI9_9HYPH
MESFVRVSGIAAPIMRINIDTDQIIPAKYLVRTSEAGISQGLFAGWRLRTDGSVNPDFILNREPYTRARIILADRNFGCGSSREAAPKALREWGIRAVIAPSFGGIFFNNCFRNGLLPVELPIEQVRLIAEQIEASGGNGAVTVDLELQRVEAPDGDAFSFRSPPLLRQMLLEGIDEIELTLSRQDVIARFRETDRTRRPWSYKPGL